jgi:hypothetical protein
MDIRRDDHPTHLAADIHELLAEEAGELGVRADVDGEVVSLHGTVATPERAEECARVVAVALPGFRVDNRVEVLADDLRPVAPEEQL